MRTQNRKVDNIVRNILMKAFMSEEYVIQKEEFNGSHDMAMFNGLQYVFMSYTHEYRLKLTTILQIDIQLGCNGFANGIMDYITDNNGNTLKKFENYYYGSW